MTTSVTFSIIIPFKDWSDYLDECLDHIQKLSTLTYEVILLPDEETPLPETYRNMPVEIIPTGKINPAVKRDIGAQKANGIFFAFIDDDAYPEPDWLDVANKVFMTQEKVGAIGGPAITPSNDPFWARVSGAVFLSRFSGGFPERYIPCPPSRRISDWPTVNLIVRKDTFEQVGGFDSDFWPGEDTLFCLKIIKKTHKEILYIPDLVVWHHRREQLSKHLRQVGNYGLHRGYFAKVFPETSRQFKYFIPTIWAGFVLSGLVLSPFSNFVTLLYMAGWTTYLVTLIASWVDIQKHETASVALGAIPHIILTHLWYGIKFAQGLTASSMKSSLGR